MSEVVQYPSQLHSACLLKFTHLPSKLYHWGYDNETKKEKLCTFASVFETSPLTLKYKTF